jgi:hypothetical protein
VKYVILIHSNPTTRRVWDEMTDEQRAQFGPAHMDFGAELAAAGVLVHSEGLADPSLGKAVWLDNGEVMTTDGPYAETKEYLAGFYVVDCETIQQACAHAARLPEAGYSQVEVRPVFDPSMLDDL